MNKLRALALAVALGLAPYAFADPVNITLTGAGNNIMAGVYINPYTATVGGVTNTLVICDDFESDTYLNETWQADEYSLMDWRSLRWAHLSNAFDRYTQAAWLTLQLLSETNATVRGQISFAIWGTFSDQAIAHITSRSPGNAGGMHHWLQRSVLEAPGLAEDQLARFVVYQPIGVGYCNGVPCGRPQEFLSVRTPESPALSILAFNLSALVGLIFLFRRRVVGSNS